MTECKDGHEFHGFVDVQPNKFACMNCNKTLDLYDDYNELLALLNAADGYKIMFEEGLSEGLHEQLKIDFPIAYAKARGE